MIPPIRLSRIIRWEQGKSEKSQAATQFPAAGLRQYQPPQVDASVVGAVSLFRQGIKAFTNRFVESIERKKSRAATTKMSSPAIALVETLRPSRNTAAVTKPLVALANDSTPTLGDQDGHRNNNHRHKTHSGDDIDIRYEVVNAPTCFGK